MAYRSWQLTGNDDVQDDVEDAAIRRLAAGDEASDSARPGDTDGGLERRADAAEAEEAAA